MAQITDIEKLRPELLDMSVAELERRKIEIDMAIEKKAAIEAEGRRKEEHEEAIGLTEELVKIVSRLHELNRLPPRVLQALSKESGEFVPGLYIKKPRS
jgi:hypothetical protein